MQTQTADLKTRYARELEAVLATVEPLPEAALRRRSPENQCSAAALAAHIAGVHANVAGWVKLIVAGEPLPPLTMADIDVQTLVEQAVLTHTQEHLASLRAAVGDGAAPSA